MVKKFSCRCCHCTLYKVKHRSIGDIFILYKKATLFTVLLFCRVFETSSYTHIQSINILYLHWYTICFGWGFSLNSKPSFPIHIFFLTVFVRKNLYKYSYLYSRIWDVSLSTIRTLWLLMIYKCFVYRLQWLTSV